MLRDQWAVQADVWSVTSWTQLRREALATDEWNYLHPQEPHRTPLVTARLHGTARTGGRGLGLDAGRP